MVLPVNFPHYHKGNIDEGKDDIAGKDILLLVGKRNDDAKLSKYQCGKPR